MFEMIRKDHHSFNNSSDEQNFSELIFNDGPVTAVAFIAFGARIAAAHGPLIEIFKKDDGLDEQSLRVSSSQLLSRWHCFPSTRIHGFREGESCF